MIQWMLERIFGDFLDRQRLTAQAAVARGRLVVLCSNEGRSGTSINGFGLRTSDGELIPLPTLEKLPIHIPPRSEVVLNPRDALTLATQGLSLRWRGKQITGVWVRRMGLKLVDVRISAEDLHALNGGDEGKFTIS